MIATHQNKKKKYRKVAGQDAINEMHPEEVKARFSNALSFFKQMDHTVESKDERQQMKRKDSSAATRKLWKAAATVAVAEHRAVQAFQAAGVRSRRKSITNEGKVISSPSTKAAEKTQQNVKLVEGVKRLINHQRRRSSSSSLSFNSGDLSNADFLKAVNSDGSAGGAGAGAGAGGAAGGGGAQNAYNYHNGDSSGDVGGSNHSLKAASPVMVALSKFDSTRQETAESEYGSPFCCC